MKNNKHREQVKLEKELKELKLFHKSAWEMYGIELCGGDMIAEEDKIIQKIKDLQKSKMICPNCKKEWDGIECDCGLDTSFDPNWD